VLVIMPFVLPRLGVKGLPSVAAEEGNR